MPLNFPHRPDLPLRNPPLVEVVCQVRMPPVLRINREEPAEFQERVRRRFPQLEVEQGVLFRVPGLGHMAAPSAEKQSRTYRFRTADETTTASLAVDFFALSTKTYSHWALFARDLETIVEAVRTVYQPAYSTRVGLRYINHLTTANTGQDNLRQIARLLRPELTALLHSEAWAEPDNLLSQLTLNAGGAKLALRVACGNDTDAPFLTLDFDHYAEGQLELDSLLERCRGFHAVIYNAFRWCVLDSGLEVFGPLAER